MSGNGEAERDRCSRDSEISVLQVRVDTLASTVTEIKDMVKRIEEAVGIVRIVQVHADQRQQEYEKLMSLTHELSTEIANVEDELSTQITNSKADLKKEITTITDVGNTREGEWKEKWSTFRGIIMAVVAVGTLLSGISMYMVKGATEIIAETYQYVQQLKTVDTLEVIKKHLEARGK